MGSVKCAAKRAGLPPLQAAGSRATGSSTLQERQQSGEADGSGMAGGMASGNASGVQAAASGVLLRALTRDTALAAWMLDLTASMPFTRDFFSCSCGRRQGRAAGRAALTAGAQ